MDGVFGDLGSLVLQTTYRNSLLRAFLLRRHALDGSSRDASALLPLVSIPLATPGKAGSDQRLPVEGWGLAWLPSGLRTGSSDASSRWDGDLVMSDGSAYLFIYEGNSMQTSFCAALRGHSVASSANNRFSSLEETPDGLGDLGEHSPMLDDLIGAACEGLESTSKSIGLVPSHAIALQCNSIDDEEGALHGETGGGDARFSRVLDGVQDTRGGDVDTLAGENVGDIDRTRNG